MSQSSIVGDIAVCPTCGALPCDWTNDLNAPAAGAEDEMVPLIKAQSALKNIANGQFYGASIMASERNWQGMYEALQEIARAALSATPQDVTRSEKEL